MNAYMKINGINGNVTANNLQNTMDLQAVSFSVTRTMNTKPGAINDRQGTRPSFSDISVTKVVDKASPLVFKQLTTGGVMPSVDLQFVHSGDNTNIYHTITLSNVLFSGYTFNHDETNADPNKEVKPTESLTLNYTQIEIKNTPYDSNNKALSPVAAGYNLETAQIA